MFQTTNYIENKIERMRGSLKRAEARRELEDGVNNYYAMSKIVGAKPTTEKWNFAQLRFVFKDKCKSVGYSDDSVLKLVSKLNLSEEVINLFKRG